MVRASKGQPVRVPTGGDYGDAKAAQAQQSAAPMQQAGPPGADTGPAPPGMTGGAFGPTQRPDEPITAGAAEGPGPGPGPMQEPVDDPDFLLRALYAAFPNPDLERLLLRRA